MPPSSNPSTTEPPTTTGDVKTADASNSKLHRPSWPKSHVVARRPVAASIR
jgi:hypothetical protein